MVQSGVVLRSVIYRKLDDGRVESDIFKYERAAGNALRELAPASSFYAGGRKVKIEQVLGGAMKLQELTHSPCVVVGCASAATARLASTFHAKVPVIGLFNDIRQARIAALFYGVLPQVVDSQMHLVDLERLVRERIFEWELAEKGDSVPLVFSQPRAATMLNTIRLVKM